MEKEKRTLKFGELFGYGAAGMFTYGFQLMVTGYYLMYFMTDVIGFSTVMAATLYTTIQWIKLITMLFSGVLIDAINFKSGKYRTWILVAGIGLGVFFPLSFVYWNLSTGAYVVVFLIMYTLMTISYNVGWTAMRAVQGKMGKNKTDVIELNTAAQIGGTASGVLYGYIGYPILGIALWAGTKQAYAGASAIYGALIIIGAIYMFCMCKKYDGGQAAGGAQKSERISFFTMLKALKGPMIPFFISMVFAMAQSGFFSTLLVYYTTYVLNDPAASALALTWTSVAGLVGSFIVPPLTKKFSKKTLHISSQALSAVGYIALALLGSTSFAFILIRSLITFVGIPTNIAMSAMCNDIGDYNEMKGNSAPRAFLQGLTGSTTRVGLILSTTIASFGLAAIGYSAGVTFDAGMISKMIMLIAVGPAIVCALSVISILFYKVDEKELSEYNRKKYAQN